MTSILFLLSTLITIPEGVPGVTAGAQCVQVEGFSEVPDLIEGRAKFYALGPVADVGEPFEGTDGSSSTLPQARLFGACHVDDHWLVAIEQGGKERSLILYSIEGFTFIGTRPLPLRPSFKLSLESLSEFESDGR